MIKTSIPRPKDYRPFRFRRIGAKLAERADRRRGKDDGTGKGQRPFARKVRKPRPKPLIAYDLETTRIRKGNPIPLYVTGYGEGFNVSRSIKGRSLPARLQSLADILRLHFLTPELAGARFVGWNANKFDTYFIGAALLCCDEFELRPYLTKSNNLRGMRVTLKVAPGDKGPSWEFLDGMAMTGLDTVKMPLKKFLALYAPEFQKLKSPDWEHEEFDATNPEHVAYAERDSEGLYHAMNRADAIVRDTFGVNLNPTIGNTGIKIFQANIPEGVQVWDAPYTCLKAIRNEAMRGGFCHLMRPYSGPIWKYDLNQAYAAAMRETQLPAGRAFRVRNGRSKYARTGIYRVRATHPTNTIPFYWRECDAAKLKDVARFTTREIGPTWITTIEIDQLAAEGWRIDYLDGYAWDDQFTMRDYVDRLETLRVNAEGGPNGPLGMMVKCIGNNSYGKTVERLQGLELLLAKYCPDGFVEFDPDTPNPELQLVWAKLGEPRHQDYHKPQIGTFITAYVRMQVRRAALRAPDAFLYADTDCVIFSHSVDLPLDAKKYGFWKLEESGAHFTLITKKVYYSADFRVKHAKGLNISRLLISDFDAWYAGSPPRQVQIQRQNFLKVMQGGEMFVERAKYGQKPLRKAA